MLTQHCLCSYTLVIVWIDWEKSMKGNAEPSEMKQEVSRRSGKRTPASSSAVARQRWWRWQLCILSPPQKKDAVMQISKLVGDHLSSFPWYYFFNWDVTLVLQSCRSGHCLGKRERAVEFRAARSRFNFNGLVRLHVVILVCGLWAGWCLAKSLSDYFRYPSSPSKSCPNEANARTCAHFLWLTPCQSRIWVFTGQNGH